MSNLIDLSTLTSSNWSYRITRALVFIQDSEAGFASFSLPADSLVWAHHVDTELRRAYFVDAHGNLGYLTGTLSMLEDEFLSLTDEWVGPTPAHVPGTPGTVSHGDALDRLQA